VTERLRRIIRQTDTVARLGGDEFAIVQSSVDHPTDATALANRVALDIGAIADEVTVAQVDAFEALEIVTSGNPYTITQAAQDEAAKNTRWVPAISSATSASIGAHVGTQAAAQAARIIFRFGL